ncbi:MAG TPA: mycothiol system anti-sigma-R factor [Micromonosporaceae bacterium]
MSCGEPHEIDCGQILNEVYLYLDLECSDDRRTRIKAHLDECSPCLREYGIEQEVKALVARCCGTDRAPNALRERLRAKINGLVPDTSPFRP